MVNFNFKLPVERGTLLEGVLMNYMFTRDIITSEDHYVEKCELDFGSVTLHLELLHQEELDSLQNSSYHEESHIKMFVVNENAEEFIEDSVLGNIESAVDLEEVEITILRLMHRLKTKTLPSHVMLFNDGSTGCQTITGD